jgi:hypothetical protein
MKALSALRGLTALCLAASVSAEVTTVADVQVLGGQHFFGGTASAVGGNINAVVTPAVKAGDYSFVPTYAGEYRGTRDVQELAGGGTLFQDSTRHSLTLKNVFQVRQNWKFKGTVGVAQEWLRETKDESWSNGLFNNRKYSGGIETEFNPRADLGYRFSYDYYKLTFPNYKSLESSQDPTLSRELAGSKVLDSGNHLFTLSGWTPFPGRMKAEWNAYMNMRSFDDQPVINSAGQPTGSDRSDTTMAFGGSLTSHPWVMGETFKLMADLGATYSMNGSNQNHYDANKAVFLADYYDYSQWSVRPGVTAGLGTTPWIVSASLGYASRQYKDRPVQDAGGNYLGGKTWVKETDLSLGLSYPWSKNFKVQARTNVAWSSSNMKYEKTFRYNYRIANYMVGFSYDY